MVGVREASVDLRRAAVSRIDIYLDALLVYALRAGVPIGVPTGAPTAEVVWSRETVIGDLTGLAWRSAGLFEETVDGRHRVVVGEGSSVVTFELGEARAASLHAPCAPGCSKPTSPPAAADCSTVPPGPLKQAGRSRRRRVE
jgi:hypothetical protein